MADEVSVVVKVSGQEQLDLLKGKLKEVGLSTSEVSKKSEEAASGFDKIERSLFHVNLRMLAHTVGIYAAIEGLKRFIETSVEAAEKSERFGDAVKEANAYLEDQHSIWKELHDDIGMGIKNVEVYYTALSRQRDAVSDATMEAIKELATGKLLIQNYQQRIDYLTKLNYANEENKRISENNLTHLKEFEPIHQRFLDRMRNEIELQQAHIDGDIEEVSFRQHVHNIIMGQIDAIKAKGLSQKEEDNEISEAVTFERTLLDVKEKSIQKDKEAKEAKDKLIQSMKEENEQKERLSRFGSGAATTGITSSSTPGVTYVSTSEGWKALSSVGTSSDIGTTAKVSTAGTSHK